MAKPRITGEMRAAPLDWQQRMGIGIYNTLNPLRDWAQGRSTGLQSIAGPPLEWFLNPVMGPALRAAEGEARVYADFSSENPLNWRLEPEILEAPLAAADVLSPLPLGAGVGTIKGMKRAPVLWHGAGSPKNAEKILKHGFSKGASAEMKVPGTSASRDPFVSLHDFVNAVNVHKLGPEAVANRDPNAFLRVELNVPPGEVYNVPPDFYVQGIVPKSTSAVYNKPNTFFSEAETFARSKANPLTAKQHKQITEEENDLLMHNVYRDKTGTLVSFPGGYDPNYVSMGERAYKSIVDLAENLPEKWKGMTLKDFQDELATKGLVMDKNDPGFDPVAMEMINVKNYLKGNSNKNLQHMLREQVPEAREKLDEINRLRAEYPKYQEAKRAVEDKYPAITHPRVVPAYSPRRPTERELDQIRRQEVKYPSMEVIKGASEGDPRSLVQYRNSLLERSRGTRGLRGSRAEFIQTVSSAPTTANLMSMDQWSKLRKISGQISKNRARLSELSDRYSKAKGVTVDDYLPGGKYYGQFDVEGAPHVNMEMRKLTSESSKLIEEWYDRFEDALGKTRKFE